MKITFTPGKPIKKAYKRMKVIAKFEIFSQSYELRASNDNIHFALKGLKGLHEMIFFRLDEINRLREINPTLAKLTVDHIRDYLVKKGEKETILMLLKAILGD